MADDNEVWNTRADGPDEVFSGGYADGNSDLGPKAIDALFELLADRWRRAVLSELAARDKNRVTLEELAASVDDRVQESSSSDQAAIRLHHVTLPQIAKTGLISYDAANGRVECHRGELLRDFLSILDGQ